jgi:hypothetical protein
MIGSIIHYNCAGSKSLAIITDLFVYRGEINYRYRRGDTIISLEWISTDGQQPQGISPIKYGGLDNTKFWKEGWERKKWYNLKHFKFISRV